MNYVNVYYSIVKNRLDNPVEGYVERHHIVPKSEGGTDNDDNIVALTAREHYICHLLLAKIYNDYKMYSAVVFMQCKTKRQKRDFKFNSHLYEQIRKDFSIKNSEAHKGHIPWNKGIPQSEEAKKKNSEAHKGRDTWMKGKHHTAEAKAKISNSKRGQQPWLKGKHHTAETKAKLSAARKGKKFKPLSDQHKKAISEGNKGRKCANKGKRWVNDGIKNSYILIGEDLPPGFVYGRIKFKHKKKRIKKNAGN